MARIVTHLKRLADGLSQEADRFRRLAEHAHDFELRRNLLDRCLEFRIRAESILRLVDAALGKKEKQSKRRCKAAGSVGRGCRTALLCGRSRR